MSVFADTSQIHQLWSEVLQQQQICCFLETIRSITNGFDQYFYVYHRYHNSASWHLFSIFNLAFEGPQSEIRVIQDLSIHPFRWHHLSPRLLLSWNNPSRSRIDSILHVFCFDAKWFANKSFSRMHSQSCCFHYIITLVPQKEALHKFIIFLRFVYKFYTYKISRCIINIRFP